MKFLKPSRVVLMLRTIVKSDRDSTVQTEDTPPNVPQSSLSRWEGTRFSKSKLSWVFSTPSLFLIFQRGEGTV